MQRRLLALYLQQLTSSAVVKSAETIRLRLKTTIFEPELASSEASSSSVSSSRFGPEDATPSASPAKLGRMSRSNMMLRRSVDD